MPLTFRLPVLASHKCAEALVCASLALAFCPHLSAQSSGGYLISTVAGASPPSAGTVAGGSLTGDGGSALLAGLGSSTAIAVDPSGNIYIADYCQGYCVGGAGSRIREITTAGIIRTIAGGAVGFGGDGGPATSAQLSAYPSGIAIDQLGNVFIADT
ncbi:MAG: hypothetical protein WBL65_00885, partial [Bryobacteraceae bacterium]